MSALISLAEFNAIVNATLDSLPSPFQELLDYTMILIDESPPVPLFGLYHGAPVPFNPSPRSFDTITLYKQTLELHSHDYADLRARIRQTLLHEIGHHFGLNEDEVDSASYPA